MSGSRRQRRWKLAFFRGALAAQGAPGLEVDVVSAVEASAPCTAEQIADVLVEVDKAISQEDATVDDKNGSEDKLPKVGGMDGMDDVSDDEMGDYAPSEGRPLQRRRCDKVSVAGGLWVEETQAR